MDLQKLRAFLCVARLKSFTKASVELFISQPALSKKISDFEKELGTPLFIRDNRVVELTEAGKLLLSEAPVLLKYGDDLEAKVKSLGENVDKRISIGCTGIEYGRLSETVSKFHNRYPEISLTMHKHTAAEIRNLIMADMLDVAFQTRFEVDNEPEIESIPFDKDRLALVVGKNHRLAEKKTLKIADIINEKYIGIQPTTDHAPFTRMINVLVDNGYKPDEVLIAPNVESMILTVSCGLAIGHLFRHTEKIYGGMLNYIDTSEYEIDLEIDMVWNKINKNKARKLFLEFVKEENAINGLE